MGHRTMNFFRYVALSLALLSAPAAAQWQTPNHSVPVGRGSGLTGFGNALPGTAGRIFTSNGPTLDPSFQPPPPLGRPVLTTTTTFFVNADGTSSHPCGAFTCSPGSNSNDGLSSATPWQTIQRSVLGMATYDFGPQTVNLQAADGTYNECILLPDYVATNNNGRLVSILGHAGSVGSVIVNCASGATFTIINANGWILKDLTVSSSTTCLFVDYHARLYWDGGTLGPCPLFHVQAVNTGAFFEQILHDYSMTGNTQCHVQTVNGAEAIWQGGTVSILGNPNFSVGLLCSTKSGLVDDTLAVFSGAFIGPKYAMTGTPFSLTSGATATTPGATQYVGLSSISATEVNYYVIPIEYRNLVNLKVNLSASPGVGQTVTATLRIGGSPSLLTCTVSGGASSSCSDDLHAGVGGSGLITIGTVIDLQVVSSGGAAPAIVTAAVVARN